MSAEIVNTETGEIGEVGATLVPINTTTISRQAPAIQELAVSGYLEQARDWLATAVEMTGPEQIAAAKAQVATAAEATKQLGLSKEIQEDAAEMVRRAEWSLRKAIKRGQESGEVTDRSHGAAVRDNTFSSDVDKVSPRSFFNSHKEYEDANAMGELDADQFEAVLAEAKGEGNLSRANVARKARARSGAPSPAPIGSAERNHQEAEVINAFASIVRRSLTPKNISTLSPKAKQKLVAILRDALDSLEGSDS